jgi:hypothetical protein
MVDLTRMTDEELMEWTKLRIGLAIRLHPRSKDTVRFWSIAYDCQEEWNRRGKPEFYRRAEKAERECTTHDD